MLSMDAAQARELKNVFRLISPNQWEKFVEKKIRFLQELKYMYIIYI